MRIPQNNDNMGFLLTSYDATISEYINSRTNQPYTLHEQLMIESGLPSGVSFEDWYAHGEQLPPCPVAQVADYLASDMPEFYRKPVQVWQAKLKRVKELDNEPAEKTGLFFED